MKHMVKILSLLLAVVMAVTVCPGFARATETEAELDRAYDTSEVLYDVLAQMATTVTEPNFGTNAGEWTVFSLARGNFFAKDDPYFTSYYDRIVATVNQEAAAVNMAGALSKNKSTENSRLIVALSAIGKDATCVGDWNLVEPYSANGINWIRKQGMNGTIWALIALDSGNYETSDPDIRQQCVDLLLATQHDDGGWSLIMNKAQPSNVDITGMALTALYPYCGQSAVAEACEKAIDWLSEVQLENGGFPYGAGETSESVAWAIVALTMWGIDLDEDARFIKNGNTAIDNLMTYYLEDEEMFEHVRGAGANNMATDQGAYALVAYERMKNGDVNLYDFSDVVFDGDEEPIVPPVEDPADQPTDTPTDDPADDPTDKPADKPADDPAEPPSEDPGEEKPPVPATKMKATLSIPSRINVGGSFNGIVCVEGWDNAEGYKLLDFIVSVPQSVTVTSVTAGTRLTGGELSYNLEEQTGKLRVVYFDANNFNDIVVKGTQTPLELVTISMQANDAAVGSGLNFAVSGMSAKRSADPGDVNSMDVVDSSSARSTATVVKGVSFSAACLYAGDDVDLIPSSKKAVAVAITDVSVNHKVVFHHEGKQTEFLYSKEISEKSGVGTFVALVDAAVPMEAFVKEENYTVTKEGSDTILFGDSNADGVINAQDALADVNLWLRKDTDPSDRRILSMNVNGDSRINTFDALGIVEFFIDGTEFGVVTKAATLGGSRS